MDSEMHNIKYRPFCVEEEIRDIAIASDLISKDLSEPYSVYVYRYFLNQWPELSFFACNENDEPVGVIICKLEPHREVRLRGYIGMISVKKEYRGNGIASKLVKIAIDAMVKMNADEIMLETEVDNKSALGLYEKMGFIRIKRLFHYYLNHSDAYRLLLPLKESATIRSKFLSPLAV